jgi:hypothetical protein
MFSCSARQPRRLFVLAARRIVLAARRGEGIDTPLISQWENAQRVAAFDPVMTSTLANEHAQHLYRRLGHIDSGWLLLPASRSKSCRIDHSGPECSRAAAMRLGALNRRDPSIKSPDAASRSV